MSLIEQLDSVRAAIDEISTTCSRVAADITDTTRLDRVGGVDVTAAERAVDEAMSRLRDAQSLLNTDGRDALQQAADKQRELGQQSDRMTEISREARQLANT